MTQMQVNMQANEEKRRSDMANEAIKQFDAESNRINAATNERNARSKEREVSVKEALQASEQLKNVGSGLGATLKGVSSIIPKFLTGGIL